MATRTAVPHGVMSGSMHTAGIFSDMTVDGPEIGTLVLVIDRAKNLPNRKTMGKQNPYCAARLGKEAKKTETDKRGGQTPRWDQELRFTVHESPDYDNLKVSVFSEDKRTDLIGEAWLGLTDVVVPGGGKSDIWQSLNYKGKYAGEIRIELTYYDSRPKPEKSEEQQNMEQQNLGQANGSSRMKRRPLPSTVNNGSLGDINGSPAASLRAKHGPREYRVPVRALSMPPEAMSQTPPRASQHNHTKASQDQQHETPSQQNSETLLLGEGTLDQSHLGQADRENYYQQPDFLPHLPPSNRQRGTQPLRSAQNEQPYPLQPRPLSHIGLSHSHSAPMIPTSQSEEPEQYDDDQHYLNTDCPEPIRDLEYQYERIQPRRNSATPVWDDRYPDAYDNLPDDADAAPPPPPLHSHSSPAIPQQHSLTNDYYQSSPSHHDARSLVDDRYHHHPNMLHQQALNSAYQTTSITANGRNWLQTDDSRHPGSVDHGSMPQTLVPGNSSIATPYTPPSRTNQPATRHSISDMHYSTPQRVHPLSQELPGSANRHSYAELPGYSPHSHANPHNVDSRAPIVKPRAISPRPAQATSAAQRLPEQRPKNSYSIQFPVRAFESSEQSPLSTSQRSALPVHQSSVARKSVSPRPSLNTVSSTPYGPDSFDVHNPHVKPSTLPSSSSPHSPYQITSDAVQHDDTRGPIVGWHGQEIDPSDHLPVNSWAPEPEKKTPVKTYGLGRERDFGPRSTQTIGTANGRISKDTVVNIRMGSGLTEAEHAPTGRNRLSNRGSPMPAQSPVEMPRNHHNFGPVPDPHVQLESSQRRDRVYGSKVDAYPPSLPPKIPMEYDQYGDESQSLQRELASIDIGSSNSRHSRAGSIPAPATYVPVRSHRDRMSYY